MVCLVSAGIWGLIKPAWPGKGLVKAPLIQTSIACFPQPGAWGREGSSLPEEQSPCRAIALPVVDCGNGEQKGKAPGACLFRLSCLATQGGPASRRDFDARPVPGRFVSGLPTPSSILTLTLLFPLLRLIASRKIDLICGEAPF